MPGVHVEAFLEEGAVALIAIARGILQAGNGRDIYFTRGRVQDPCQLHINLLARELTFFV